MCFKEILLCAFKGLYYVLLRDFTMCFKGTLLCALKGLYYLL